MAYQQSETRYKTQQETQVGRRWYLVDAKDQVLGRLASQVAKILRGKHNPYYATHNDTGDFVVVINAAAIKLTGAKMTQKVYTRHTGWAGGIRTFSAAKLFDKNAVAPLTIAIRGMLPKNTLGRAMLKKLKIYADATHPHQAQKAQPLQLF